MSNAVHGRNTAVWSGAYDISNYLNSFKADRNAPELDSTTFQDTARTYVATFQEGGIDLEGFFSIDATDNDTAEDRFRIALASSTNTVVSVAPEGGSTFGNRVILCDATENNHAISSQTQSLIQSNASFRGQVDHGVLLAAKAARTSSGNGTGVDNVVATYNGGVGHQHVFAVSGTSPTLDTKIQHSTDNSTFVDLITFTQATAITGERISSSGLSQSQVETATVGGAATASANVIVTVTAANITGSPIATNVAVINGDTASQVATKIRTALDAVAAITSKYTVSGATTEVILTSNTALANDATLNIAIDGSTNSTGVPDAATSANTTAGIASRSVYRYTRETRTIGGSSTPTFTNAVAFARQ